MELRKIDRSAPWGVPGRRPWVAVWFQECNVPVFGFRGIAAKSFVLRRCSNLFFPAPIIYLGEQYIFPQRMPPGHNLPRRAIPGRQRHSLPLP